jgi:hypothetical protein
VRTPSYYLFKMLRGTKRAGAGLSFFSPTLGQGGITGNYIIGSAELAPGDFARKQVLHNNVRVAFVTLEFGDHKLPRTSAFRDNDNVIHIMLRTGRKFKRLLVFGFRVNAL